MYSFMEPAMQTTVTFLPALLNFQCYSIYFSSVYLKKWQLGVPVRKSLLNEYLSMTLNMAALVSVILWTLQHIIKGSTHSKHEIMMNQHAYVCAESSKTSKQTPSITLHSNFINSLMHRFQCANWRQCFNQAEVCFITYSK